MTMPSGIYPRASLEERFWDKVDRWDPDHCWEWTGTTSRDGYGLLSLPRDHSPSRMVMAHRYAYETLVGPIPDGLTIDHLCRNRKCENPAHMEPVTIFENMRRGKASRTHCKRGHEYSPENTYYGKASRQCRLCQRIKDHRRRTKVSA